jgi:antitoxin (DNA-binding transcriptional repressor) of toxin-antitoxin stability system
VRRTLKARTASRRFSEVLDYMSRPGAERVVILRRGRAVAVIVPLADLAILERNDPPPRSPAGARARLPHRSRAPNEQRRGWRKRRTVEPRKPT